MFRPPTNDFPPLAASFKPRPALSIIDLSPLKIPAKRWSGLVGPAFSAALLVAIFYLLRTIDFAAVLAIVPSSPFFWCVFLLFYFAQPIADWVIFRRLWRIPVSGLLPLIQKTVSNELLISYMGEAQFYNWARRRARVSAAPFGAVKDVAILSAMAGNAATLTVLAFSAFFLPSIDTGIPDGIVILSLGAILLTTAIPMVWRRRVFSLPRRELWFAFHVHMVRLIIVTVMAALLWHLVLPDIPFGWLILLATLRLMIGRLPFMPNKDLVFAGLAALLVGSTAAVAELMTMMAGLLILAHISCGIITSAVDLRQGAAQ